MKITIIGAGSVGTHLAKYLSGEHMDIFIVDINANKLMSLNAEYNLMTIVGDGTVFSTLRQAEVENCDLFVAVTDVAERNIVACGIAKSMGARMTLARVDRYDYLEAANQEVINRIGVDHTIFPEFLIAQGIIESLQHSWSRDWYEFNKGQLIMTGLRLAADAPIAGKRLRDLAEYHETFHIAVIRRQFVTLIPNGNHQLMPDDIIYVTTSTDKLKDVAQLTGNHPFDIKRVVIAGSGKITEMTVAHAPKNFNFTIIENDVERARELVRVCHGADVINGEASEFEVLEEADIAKADAFVALGSTSEGNILSCLNARDFGVKKTIAEVKRQQFFNMAESFHIGTLLNKQMLFANAVFQLLIDEGSSQSKRLALPDAEVVKLDIKAGAKVTTATVKELRIPEEITFAGYIRDNRTELVTGKTHLQAGDQVLVVCLQGSLQKAKNLFK